MCSVYSKVKRVSCYELGVQGRLHGINGMPTNANTTPYKGLCRAVVMKVTCEVNANYISSCCIRYFAALSVITNQNAI